MIMKSIICGCRALFLAGALMGVSTLAARSQDGPAVPGTNSLTLEAAIGLALEANPGLRAAGARVLASSGRAQQAGVWKNPELELSAEDWPLDQGNGFSDAKHLIGIRQVLPYPGKKPLDRRIGSAGVRLSEAERSVLRTEIVRDVKAGFYRVLAAERTVEVSAKLAGVAESAAATARKRVDAGAAAYQEQLRAEVQLEQARTEMAERQRELAMARQVLATLLGQPELNSVRLAGALIETPNPALLSMGEEEWLTRHPSAAAAQAGVERAELEARRARMEKYPDVTLGVAGGRVGATDESILQLGVSIPLPVLDRGKGREREANANVEVATADHLSVQQQLQREWANARQRYRTAMEQVARYRERILPKAEEALRLVQIGFEQGKFGFIDLVDTQRTDAEAHLGYHEKLLELNIARAELEALLQPQTDPTAISP
jgi:cobalt-zinc-cadmium efflux system outer membrane protein